MGGGQPNVAQDADRELRKFDRNADGRLERSEWPETWPEAQRMDANDDGFITVPELSDYSAELNARRPDRVRGENLGLRPGFGSRVNELEAMRQQDPEMFALVNQDEQLEQQTADLADQARRASGEQQAKLKVQLIELVNKHFEVRQQRRELQLKRMETELGRLREAIKERNDARALIIQQRLTELTGEVRDLGF